VVRFLGDCGVLEIGYGGFVVAAGSVYAELRNGDGSQDTDDGDNDQDLDERKAIRCTSIVVSFRDVFCPSCPMGLMGPTAPPCVIDNR
jgi:hypothetical protein